MALVFVSGLSHLAQTRTNRNRVCVTRFSVPALAEERWRRRSLVGVPKSLIDRPSDTWVLFSQWFFEAINLDSGILKLDGRRQPTPSHGPSGLPVVCREAI